MLGAIIGDIVGSRWEFDPTNDYDFEMFSQENSFTDDTVCTVAVADAIAEIRRNLGTQFDPQVGQVFIQLVENGTISIQRYSSQ